MAALATLLLLLQVDPFKVESKKITPEISRVIDKLNAYRNEAFEQARLQTSATLPATFAVILEAVDAADPDPAKFTRHSGIAAETSTVADDPVRIVRIRYYIEYFANGLGTPQSTLLHEMVHAVMRLDLGREKYSKVPRWFREGIAVFIAGQIPEKLNHGLMNPEIARDPEKMVDGIDDADHTLSDYWEDAMGILFLGKAPLKRVIDRLRTGEAIKEAIAAETGGAYDKFVEGSRESALQSLKTHAERNKDMLDAYAIIAQLNEKSGALCDEFLKKWPKSPLTSAVLYYRAKSAPSDRIARLDDFISSAYGPDGKVDFIDDAKLRKARLLAQERKPKEAAAIYADLVRWHVGSPAAVDALFEWGLLEKKVPLLQRAIEIAPKHPLADKARKTIGD